MEFSKMKIFHPYNIVMDLDNFFKSRGGQFTNDEFYSLVEAIQASGSERKQDKTAAFFKTLPREEVIRRSVTITRLDKLLKNIKSNRKSNEV